MSPTTSGCREASRERVPAERDDLHPAQEHMGRFMRGELPRAEVRTVVRHLLTRCPKCTAVTRRYWDLGELQILLDEGLALIEFRHTKANVF
jgi:hypothetical protein